MLTTGSVVVVLVSALAAAAFAGPRRAGWSLAAAAAACASLALPATGGAVALAIGLGLHAFRAGSRSGSVALVGAASAALGAGGALLADQGELALVASLLGLALRTGVVPLHLGTSALAERRPIALAELTATAPAAVLWHLRHAVPAAPELAEQAVVPLVVAGAIGAVLSGLASLSSADLRNLWSTSVSMHAGLLLAAIGTAGRGSAAAAVFVSTSFTLALVGLGVLLVATEDRTGPIDLRGPGGRSSAFPRITWTFAFFAAAGIALPGTVGFAADDLLLHAAWPESRLASGALLAASAALAVGSLRAFGAAFLGPAPRIWTASDLAPAERAAVLGLLAALLFFGLRPSWLLGAVQSELASTSPHAAEREIPTHSPPASDAPLGAR